MSPLEKIVRTTITWAVTLMIPLILLMTSIRVLMTPAFLQFEYHLPGFPADSYGFTLQDRLHWGGISVDYLVNNADISFLANQRLPDGQPLYNDRELSHMQDVKNLVQLMIKVWVPLLGVTVGLGLASWGARWSADYRRGLSRGGWLTIGIVFAILLGVVLNFNTLFTDFHRIFFKGDTWLFYYSDSLIRLFPIPFWEIGFVMVGALSLLGGLALGIFTRPRPAKVLPVKASSVKE